MKTEHKLRGQFKTPSGMMDRMQFAEMLAAKHKTDVKTALTLIKVCEKEDEIEEDSPTNHYALLEEACHIIEYTDGNVDELPVAICKPEFEVGSDQSILDAAIDTRLDNGYSKLAERYDFGPHMTQFKPKAGVIPTPEDYAGAIGMGVDMSSKGMWLAGDGIRHLMAMGHENVLAQIAASLKLSYSHVSNWHRAAQRIPIHLRHEISPTVAIEIATAKFSDNEIENNKQVLELVQQARAEKWSCAEARSHVKMLKGQEPLGKIVKTDKWVKHFGGSEQLLILAIKHCLSDDASEIDREFFLGKLREIFHELSDKTQDILNKMIEKNGSA
jgi:hypothetical protein